MISLEELLSKERPIFETLLVKERNNSIKLFSKFKNTKNIVVNQSKIKKNKNEYLH